MSETAIASVPLAKPVHKAPRISHAYVLPFAPPMPPEFYGTVSFQFQGGRMTLAVVEEKIKPA